MTAIENCEVRVGELAFDARVAGPADGPCVLLLHGFPETSEQWCFLQPALANAGFRVIAFDQRGYSPRARPMAQGDYQIEHLVADVMGVVGAFGIDRFHVVGHDWGGVVGWHAAAAYSHRLLSLVAVSTPHPEAFASALRTPIQAIRAAYIPVFVSPIAEKLLLNNNALVLRVLLKTSGLPTPFIEKYVTAMEEPGALTAALNWYRANAVRAVRAVGKIDVRTTFVWGDRDPAIGAAAARRTHGYVNGEYNFHPLEGVGHWIPERHGDALAELVLAHLASV